MFHSARTFFVGSLCGFTLGAFLFNAVPAVAPGTNVLSAQSQKENEALPSSSPAQLKKDSLPISSPILEPTLLPVIQKESGLLGLINDYRVGKGMAALINYAGLCAYSDSRKDSIMQFSHGSFGQDNFKAYCSDCNYVGENISQGYSDTDALNAWLGSDAHRPNIEGDWKYGCVNYFPNNTLTLTVGK